MKIIINSSSMVPIYEQIMDQIKAQITAGDLRKRRTPLCPYSCERPEDQCSDCQEGVR